MNSDSCGGYYLSGSDSRGPILPRLWWRSYFLETSGVFVHQVGATQGTKTQATDAASVVRLKALADEFSEVQRPRKSE
jgi:hypothetical protein